MKKLLIIPLLIVGFIIIKTLETKINRNYCKEFCMYDEETNSVPCGNCWADCMGEW